MLTVSEVNGQLKIDINNFMNYELEHWHYDTFISNKDPKWRSKFLINFNLNQSGQIKELVLFGEIFTKTP